MVAMPLPGEFKARSLDQEVARFAGVRPALTVDLARGKAWLRGRAMPSDSIPGFTSPRASAATAQTLDGQILSFLSGVAARVPGRGQLIQGARTNKCTNYNAAPNGSLTNLTKSGDAAATLTEVDDTAALAAAGLSALCPSGKVFKLDNSAGSGVAVAIADGPVGNLNTHYVSAYIRGSGTGSVRLEQGAIADITLTESYTRNGRSGVADATGRRFTVRVNAGGVLYFILNQLEEGSFATSPIVVAGASATCLADAPVIDLLNPGLDVSGQANLWSDGAATTIGETQIVSPGVFRIYSSAGLNSYIRISSILEVGKLYEVRFNVDSIAVVGAGVRVGDTGATYTTTGEKVSIFRADATMAFIKRHGGATDIQISGVQFRQIPAEQVIDYPLTIYARFERAVDTGAAERIVRLDAGSNADWAAISVSTSDLLEFRSTQNSVAQSQSTVAGAIPLRTPSRGAARFATDNVQGAKGGDLGTADTSAVNPAPPTRIQLGHDASGNELNGYLAEFSIIPGGLADAALQRLARAA